MCAHAVRVQLRKIEGVRDVTVSLRDGIADIRFAPGNRVTTAQVWTVVRAAGFAARSAQVVAEGVATTDSGRVIFTVGGSGQAFVLDGADGRGGEAAERSLPLGVRLTVHGEIPGETARSGAAAVPLRVRAVGERPDGRSPTDRPTARRPSR